MAPNFFLIYSIIRLIGFIPLLRSAMPLAEELLGSLRLFKEIIYSMNNIQ
jgi:hypothetical protein